MALIWGNWQPERAGGAAMSDPTHGHGHGHGHGRPVAGTSRWSRLRHRLTPHSHDSAERTDRALEDSARGMRTLGWSFAVLLVTALVQLALVLVTGSVALLGDTIHNFADALTALPLGVAFVLGRRAATRRYPYGLGRAEDLAGMAVVLVMAVSAGLAGYEAVLRLVRPAPINHLWVVAVAGVVGFLGNELVARWRITVGREIGSAALVADGLHARTDGFTSLAVVAGAAGVAVGAPVVDPLVGLGITAGILLVLRDAIREVFRRLLDAADPASLALAEHTAAGVPGVRSVREVRMRWIGHTQRAEVTIAVDDALSVVQAHRIAHDVEHALVHALRRLRAATVHTEPAGAAQPAHDQLAHHH
jgi:cation diffusion facilitator family transporter